MEFLERGLPRKLPSKVWLISLPATIISFERRSDVPKLPETGSRALGALLLLGAAGLAALAVRRPEASLAYEGPMSPVVQRPARLAGLVAIAGLACVTRSTALLVYALGLAAAAGTGQMAIEEPTSQNLLGIGGDGEAPPEDFDWQNV
jgi:hypothetical protein